MYSYFSFAVTFLAQASIVYLLLICVQYFNNVATVLLYALLCCIYAALFGVVFYFFPRLLTLLTPVLDRHHGLSARMLVCTCLCLVVFGAHTIGYARRVVAPPRKVFWWWNYGALELLPTAIFIAMMHPKTTKHVRGEEDGNLRANDSPDDLYGTRKVVATIKRSNSASGRRSGETTSLLKPTMTYGSASGTPPPVGGSH